MTKITLDTKYIEIKGHSGYETRGKDIVCAAISTLIESTYNYLIATDNIVEKEENEALFIIKFKGLNKSGLNILDMFEKMIKDLEMQYSKFIKVIDRRERK